MRWSWLLIIVAVALTVCGVQRQRAHQRGEALFHGLAPLPARLNGHADALPPKAARCANCHADGANRLGPPLAAAALTAPQRRRGGPPSRYDGQTLCRALRHGVDPAGVTLTRAMPLYDASDADCDALWGYLSTR